MATRTTTCFDPPVAIVPATPGVTNGTAATREEAMAKFRAARMKAKGETAEPAPRSATGIPVQ
jgi:hypothetical protein